VLVCLLGMRAQHPLPWDGGVLQLAGALGQPASELDVGLQVGRVQAGVEVAVVDRVALLEDVAVVQFDGMADADPVGEVT
jgi:hypothetical protein